MPTTDRWAWSLAVMADPDLPPEAKEVCYAVVQIADENGKFTSDDLEDYFGLPRGSLRDE